MDTGKKKRFSVSKKRGNVIAGSFNDVELKAIERFCKTMTITKSKLVREAVAKAFPEIYAGSEK